MAKDKKPKPRHVWGRFVQKFKDKKKYNRKQKHKEKY